MTIQYNPPRRKRADSYHQVAIETMTRSALRDVGTVLDIHQMSAHVFMAPGGIARKIGDVVPLIIRTPGKIHGVDLRTSAEG